MSVSLLRRLHRFARELQEILETAAAPDGITAAEAETLACLVERGPCPIGALQRDTGYRPSTLTSILDRLAARGWIARDLSSRDRRSFVVSLTREGRRVGRRIEARLDALGRTVARRVPAAAIAALERLPGDARTTRDHEKGARR